VVLWWLTKSQPLSAHAHSAIADPGNGVYVSAATAWEIAIKRTLGKLQAPENLREMLRTKQLQPLAIQFHHALAVQKLPLLHTDPFDRMLIAQAQEERLTLITRDPAIMKYDIDIIPA